MQAIQTRDRAACFTSNQDSLEFGNYKLLLFVFDIYAEESLYFNRRVMRGMYFNISSGPQDYSVLIKCEMISGVAESSELGIHGQCQVQKHVGKIFVLISCNLFVLAVPYSLLDFFPC
jgi:hypothetical protein